LTPLLKKLEEKGLVNRRRSTTDERNLIVSITEAGEALKEQAKHIPGEMSKCLVLTKEETISLYQLLYKMLTYVTD
ncbi:MAG: MarR family transcriptional regulator, partial [Oscillospiraceae bacterium]|nr:MarR family transcriptional regulator [Oscillospiraceae bacterium]